MRDKKNNNKKIIIAILILLGLGYLYIAIVRPFNFLPNSTKTAPVKGVLAARFDYLSKNGNTNCSKEFTNLIPSKSDTDYLRGSCCSPMDWDKYKEQIEGLKKYKDIPQIPSDPYNIPVKLAKELLQYNKTIIPTKEEQKILDEGAMGSEEKGFCCCKCWRWDAHEGLSKFLVRNYHFNAKQISEILNLQDGCGGSN